MIKTLEHYVGKEIRVAGSNNTGGCGVRGVLSVEDNKYLIKHSQPNYDWSHYPKTLGTRNGHLFTDEDIFYIDIFVEDCDIKGNKIPDQNRTDTIRIQLSTDTISFEDPS